MSISIMDRVWRNSKASQGKLLILLAIADFANDNGEAWPSVPTLAKKSRLKERQTQYAIKSLVRSGELKIHKNKGPRGCHIYHITISHAAPGAETAPVQELRGALDGPRGALDGNLGVHSTAPEPSENRHNSSNGSKNRPSRCSSRKIQLADDEHIAKLKTIYQPRDVDKAVANCKAWLLTPNGKGKSFTTRRLQTFLRNAEPLSTEPNGYAGKREEW
jgi:Helix-turn-helix domain